MFWKKKKREENKNFITAVEARELNEIYESTLPEKFQNFLEEIKADEKIASCAKDGYVNWSFKIFEEYLDIAVDYFSSFGYTVAKVRVPNSSFYQITIYW
jgi:hypothetical protein